MLVLDEQSEPVDVLAVVGGYLVVVEPAVVRQDHLVVALHTEVLVLGRYLAPVGRFAGGNRDGRYRSAVACHQERVTLLDELRQQSALDIALGMHEGGADIGFGS